jgi:DUF3048 family protein/Big-like domain-containing protein
MALVIAVVFVLASAGAYMAYENTLPTTLSTNLQNGEKDVPIYGRILFTFSRPVAQSAVQAAFTITPDTQGSLSSVSGETDYAWSPSQPLVELTTYTVSMKTLVDAGHRTVHGATWSFTTIIVPRITSVTTTGGAAVSDGSEVDPGSILKFSFNDAMVPETFKLAEGAQPAALKWAGDDRSATLSLAGVASGPINFTLSPGARDQTGHFFPAAFGLSTGVYYHDHEHTIALKYPALVQIPNDELAWDQNGLQAAGIVFEYLAEGGITRLTAIYDNAPDLIGPMRSSRFISLKIGRHYKGLLFQSGESQATLARAHSDPTPQFFDTIGYQFRIGNRYEPDNLMIKGAGVNAAESNYFSRIPAFIIPKARPDITNGTGAMSVSVSEHYSVYHYDPITGTYSKAESGHPFLDAGLGQRLRIEMLITLHTQESLLNIGDGHGSYIHDFNLDSGGAADFYYKGQGYKGYWKAPDSHGPLTFILGNGQSLSLPPGLVWIDVTA